MGFGNCGGASWSHSKTVYTRGWTTRWLVIVKSWLHLSCFTASCLAQCLPPGKGSNNSCWNEREWLLAWKPVPFGAWVSKSSFERWNGTCKFQLLKSSRLLVNSEPGSTSTFESQGYCSSKPSGWMNWFQLALNRPIVCCSCGENGRVFQVFLQSQRLKPEPLSRIFPSWVESVCCIILSSQMPFPGRDHRPGFTCSQDTNMHPWTDRGVFLEPNSPSDVGLLLWRPPEAESASPQTSLWPFDSNLVF